MRMMLVLDIDGTCITDNYDIPDELVKAIKYIQKKHLVYIATGRSVSDAYQYYKVLGLDNDIICHNGGLICNPQNGIVKIQKKIHNSVDIVEFLLKWYNDKVINNVVLSSCRETFLLTTENQYLQRVMINQDLPFSYESQYLTQVSNVQRIIVSVLPQYQDALTNEIKKLFSDIIVCGWRGRDDIIDISVGGVNKWNAVKYVAEENNISVQNIISFGDAVNDIKLLEKSGIGISMKNAIEEVRNSADYITDFDNNGNGVYYFLVNQLSEVFNISEEKISE